MRSGKVGRQSTYQTAVAVAVAVCLVVAGCSGDSSGDGEPEAFSVLASLQQLPLSVGDDLPEGSVQIPRIVAADQVAVAEQGRLQRPADLEDFDRASTDQLYDFYRPFVGAANEAPRLHMELPEFLETGVLHPDAFVAEVGFSPGEVTTFAAIGWDRTLFEVFGGVSASPDLPEIAPGVRALGDGDDFEIKSDSSGRPLRPLGSPLRVAERDGLVALSRGTEPVVEWLEPTDVATFADDRVLAQIAMRLDEASVISAVLYRFDNADLTDRLGNGVGLGWTAEGEDPRGVIVFGYGTEADAQERLAQATTAFEGEFTPRFDEDPVPVSDVVTVDQIEVRGSEIVITVRFADSMWPGAIEDLAFKLDLGIS